MAEQLVDIVFGGSNRRRGSSRDGGGLSPRRQRGAVGRPLEGELHGSSSRVDERSDAEPTPAESVLAVDNRDEVALFNANCPACQAGRDATHKALASRAVGEAQPERASFFDLEAFRDVGGSIIGSFPMLRDDPREL